MALKYLNFTGLTDLVTNLMNWVTSRIPTKTSEIDNDSGYLTASDLPTNHVTTNTNQTISGAKTLSNNLYFSANTHRIIYMNNTAWTMGEAIPSSTKYIGSIVHRCNGTDCSYIDTRRDTTGNVYQQHGVKWKFTNGVTATDGTAIESIFAHGLTANGTRYVYWNGYLHNINVVPITNNNNSLGDSTHRWTNVYGTVRLDPAAGATADLLYSQMAANDLFRLQVGGTSNNGYVEIATADDGNEPIYVRQYKGVFSTLQRTLTLLDGSGNTTLPGTLNAVSYKLNGTAFGDIVTHNASEFLTSHQSLTNYATKTYVDTSVANLVNSAPATLDTLNELATALGNDPNFATTVATSIGTKANDSDVVHLAGTETITGTKIFQGHANLKQASYEIGSTPSSNSNTFIQFIDKNLIQTGWVGRIAYTNGYDTLTLSNTNRFTNGAKATNGTAITSVFEVGLSPAGIQYLNTNAGWICTVRSAFNNTYNLGSPDYKWKTAYVYAYHAYDQNAFTAKNGNYTFLIRNDGSNTYFLMSESGGNEGTWSSARPLIINNSTGICNINGNAATSTQFSANKDVTLTGYVNGTASSKAGWSITTALKNCYFHTTGTVTNTYFKVASGVIAGGWNRYEAMIRFVEITGNASCTMRIYIQLDGSSLFSAGYVTIMDSKSYGTDQFYVMYKNDTDRTLLEIYYQLPTKNHQVNALVLYETERKLANTCNVLTMYNDSTPVASLPSDYTLITTDYEKYTGNFLPIANNVQSLGDSSYKWNNVYATTFTGNLLGNITSIASNIDLTDSTTTGTKEYWWQQTKDKNNTTVTCLGTLRAHSSGSNQSRLRIWNANSKWADLILDLKDDNTYSIYTACSTGVTSSGFIGNASTATQFSANTTVALTGDATGTSAGSKKGWSVPVTLANSGVTAGTYGPSADVTGNNNSTISVPQITVDAKGRVTSVTNRTLTCKNNTYNVYNKTLTIQKNGTNVATFTSNSNTDVTANITVPTKTSELTNDSNFLTSHQSLVNYVTASDANAQAITGPKFFRPTIYLQDSNVTSIDTTQSTLANRVTQGSIAFCAQIQTYGTIEHYFDTDRSSVLKFSSFNKKTTGQSIYANVVLRNNVDGIAEFSPEGSSYVNLGSADRPWHTINGLNPGSLGLPSVGLSTSYDIDTTNWDVTGGDIHVVVQDSSGKTVPGYVMIYLSKCAATDFVVIQLTSMARSAGVYVPAIKSGRNYYVKACFPTSGDCYVNIVKTAGTIGYAKLYPFLGNQGFVHPS